MLYHSLKMEDVLLPEHPPTWPAPFNLTLGLKEFLLVEGMNLEESEVFLKLAATLFFPLSGRIWLWDQETSQISRPELFRLRSSIAYIPAHKVLIHRLTVLENLTLSPYYRFSKSQAAIREEQAELIDLLELGPYLSFLPTQLPDDLYIRVIWARELIKESEIIIAIPQVAGELQQSQDLILTLLQHFLARRQGSVMLVGNSLEVFYPLAHRRLVLAAGQLTEYQMQGPQDQPLFNFMNLL